ncbi:ShlB/FhaC/HecB family hemolysin secretion/activation protein [Erythrobacter sp. EC-HK427]|uniref:ShlB/FhaC/HecB family hemolysin secretion/activation protein n=1 Tax=Erythrobacter sp. EC-HK427 TaxID=2038396 RepID=UPI001251E7F6|nr:ShlB/FhaC/HecB family hemolysin secretion/activation protein [Erythrobacter sp. EC-HK427]VVT18051.1 Hemolysin activation/secretion protein [Erythrobacter sp. EC-HK427]
MRVRTEGGLEDLPCALDDSTVPVTLTAVVFEGNERGSSPPADILQLLEPLSTPPQGERPVSVVCDIRDAVNQRLEAAGYIALAQIPAQEIADGVLTLRIVSARFTEMRVVGDVGGFEDTIRERALALQALPTLNRREIERALLAAGDIPGVDITMSISPARDGVPGNVIGILNVQTRRFQAIANIQNYGSEQLGRWVATVRGEAYGLTGMSDRTVLTYSNSLEFDEIRVFQASHDFALNDNGLRAELRGSMAWSVPDIENLTLRSRSIIAGVEVQQQLVRSVNFNVLASGGFEFLQQRTLIESGGQDVPFSKDDLRVFYARAQADYYQPLLSGGGHRISGYIELRKGFEFLGSSVRGQPNGRFSPSRFDGDPAAFVARAEVQGEVQVAGPLALEFGAFGQWTNEPLLNLEEWTLGNFTYGRGYDPGANSGDRVLAGRIQPSIGIPVGQNARIELLGFYDWVRIDNLDAGSVETGRELTSLGGGVRVLLPGRLSLEAYYAAPQDPALSTDDEPPPARFLLTLSTRFYPWGIN